MGKINLLRTTFPFSFAGFHLGIDFTTRKASASKRGSRPTLIFTFVILPSFSTTNPTNTLPEMFFSLASVG